MASSYAWVGRLRTPRARSCPAWFQLACPTSQSQRRAPARRRGCTHASRTRRERGARRRGPRVAERPLEVLTADGLTPLPKTSDSKGLQIYSASEAASPSARPPTPRRSPSCSPPRCPSSW